MEELQVLFDGAMRLDAFALEDAVVSVDGRVDL